MNLSLSRSAPVIIKDAVPSTNTVLKQLVPQSPPEGLVLAAKKQLSGRGRLGRSFESPEGGLYLSMLLYPKCAPEKLGTITPCAAVAVRRAIERICDLKCDIKWPNDLQYKGRKICGILTESSSFRLKTFVVLGIGINVNSDIAAFPEELRHTAGSLAAALGRKIPLEEMIKALIEELDSVYALWQNEPGAFLEEYRAACINVGRDVFLIENGMSRPAHVTGIDENYALLVNTEQGEECISTGEVSLREK